jgi:hypothetical protein
MMDVDQAAQAVKDAGMEAEIEDFLEGFNQPTYHGMRVRGGGANPAQSKRYEYELPYFCAEVLPRLARAGLREPPK